MKKSIKISGLLSALLFVCGSAHAAGLGKLSVQSALGQPLKAEIELLSVNKEDLSAVTARLASYELFRQARIDRASSLSALQFEVVKGANGQPVIRISSSNPMSDPFLDMLIELNWSSGRIIREYTILLDPPRDGRATTEASAIKAPMAASGATEKAAAPQEAAKPAGQADKMASEAAPKPMPSRYGPVKSGETLRSIAGRVKGTEVTLEQMMAGLYLTNKSAFIQSNMNLLKKGAVLNVPTAEAVHMKTSPSQAIRLIQTQTEEWHAYRNKVAGMAETVPDARDGGQAASGKIETKVEDKSPAAASRDVLKLSKGEPAGEGKPDAKAQARMQSLEEEVAAKSRALQESQDRVSQLERTVQDLQQLLEMKSQEAAKPPATGETAAPEATPQAAEPAPAETQEPVEKAAEEMTPPAKPKPAPLPPPQAQEESSWISTFLKNPIYIGGLVIAVLLSGLLWMFMVGNRRRQGLNKFEDSIMTGGEFKSGAVFNTAGTGSAAAPGNTEGSMLLTDFSRLGLGAIDTHEVDPIAEAEVYMAYGRDAQAEEILKEALDKDSSRHEIALKLLEIYAARKDPLAFETTASELYAGLGGQDTPVWQRAAEMGHTIDPDNPLYRMAQGQSFAASSESATTTKSRAAEVEKPAVAGDDGDMGLDFESSLGGGKSETADFEVQGAGQDDSGGMDFTSAFEAPKSLDMGNAAQTGDTSTEDDGMLSMDDMSMAFEPAKDSGELETLDELGTPDLEMELGDIGQSAESATSDLTSDIPEFQALSDAEAGEELTVPDVIELDLPEESELGGADQVAPELDLSGIDLELGADMPQETLASLEDNLEIEAPEVSELDAMLEMPAEADAETAAESSEPETAEEPAAAPEDMDPTLWEEVNTKLDLARAYLEMGDREGAREILQEVTQEGDSKQKSEANKLLSEAG